MDYTIFYKSQVEWDRHDSLGDYDVYVSAYNPSDRVGALFQAVRARRKIWVIQPEYGLDEKEYPKDGEILVGAAGDEIAFGQELTRIIKIEEIW